MKKEFQRIIEILKRAKGQPVFREQIYGRSAAKLLNKKDGSENPRNKGRKKTDKKTLSDPVLSKIDSILKDLEEYKLIHMAGGKIIPTFPLFIDARLSVAGSGVAFGMGSFENDIFISPARRNGANHRDRVWIELTGVGSNRYEGRVVSIIESFATEYLARVESKYQDGYALRLIDLPDRPAGYLYTNEEQEPGAMIVVQETGESVAMSLPADEFPSRGQSRRNPRQKERVRERAFIREVLVYRKITSFAFHNFDSDIHRVTMKYNIPPAFPKDAMPEKKEIKAAHKEGQKDPRRKNLSKLFTCTIDGADSKDFDDAISYEERDGVRILYVHIADVSHYVKPGELLDQEAFKRGNSYYLKHKVFPMLPPILSEEFCSLKPKTTRLGFTCEMHYDGKANLLRYDIYKSIVHMNKRYTYVNAEKELDNQKSPLAPIWLLSDQLRRKRIQTGKIELNIPEVEPAMDAHGRIIALNDKIRLNSHKLVEECMLSANTCTAHFLRTHHKVQGLYRMHEPMPDSGVKKINSFLKLYGYRIQMKNNSPQEITRVLKAASGSKEEQVVNMLLLRSFSQAVYTTRAGGHWALAFSDYTHFTSPIRRYADLVVHRQLEAILNKTTPAYGRKELAHIATETSRQERVAMEAENMVVKLLSLRYLANREGEIFEATVSGFNSSGVFISLDKTRFDGFIPAERKGVKAEMQIIDDFRAALPGGRVVMLGANIVVKLVKVDREKIQPAFRLIDIIRSGR